MSRSGTTKSIGVMLLISVLPGNIAGCAAKEVTDVITSPAQLDNLAYTIGVSQGSMSNIAADQDWGNEKPLPTDKWIL